MPRLSFSARQLQELLQQYNAARAPDELLAQLRACRREITELWLSPDASALPDLFAGEVGQCHRLLMDSGLREEPRTPDDADLVAQITECMSGGWGDPRAAGCAMAAMLHLRAFQLSEPPLHLPTAPRWLLADWLDYLLESPAMFAEVGFCDAHGAHLRRIVEYLHDQVMSQPGDAFWQQIAKIAASRISIIPLYFTNANLKPVAHRRGDLLELALRCGGDAIDYAFAPRSPQRQRERIRVGVIAGAFGADPGSFDTLAFYEHLDRARFELIMYVLHPSGSPAERVCFARADRVVQVSNHIPETVKRMRADDLDVLLIASNLATRNVLWTRLGAHRLARVQFINFTSPATSGLKNIDYFVSGTLSEPSDGQQHYREKLVQLEGSGLCFDLSPQIALEQAGMQRAPSPVTRTMLGIDADAIVYSSGANFFKLIPELTHVWARIIAAVPRSVLLLYPFGPAWSPAYPREAFLRQIQRVAASHGAASNRFIIAPSLPDRAHVLSVLRSLADIYLDSFPHAGGNSLLDALELSLPSVALNGQTLRGRHGAALLSELGVGELVADNTDAYIDLAVRLGCDHAYRRAMHVKIEQSLSLRPRFLDTRWHGDQAAALYEEWMRVWDEPSTAQSR